MRSRDDIFTRPAARGENRLLPVTWAAKTAADKFHRSETAPIGDTTAGLTTTEEGGDANGDAESREWAFVSQKKNALVETLRSSRGQQGTQDNASSVVSAGTNRLQGAVASKNNTTRSTASTEKLPVVLNSSESEEEAVLIFYAQQKAYRQRQAACGKKNHEEQETENSIRTTGESQSVHNLQQSSTRRSESFLDKQEFFVQEGSLDHPQQTTKPIKGNDLPPYEMQQSATTATNTVETQTLGQSNNTNTGNKLTVTNLMLQQTTQNLEEPFHTKVKKDKQYSEEYDEHVATTSNTANERPITIMPQGTPIEARPWSWQEEVVERDRVDASVSVKNVEHSSGLPGVPSFYSIGMCSKSETGICHLEACELNPGVLCNTLVDDAAATSLSTVDISTVGSSSGAERVEGGISSGGVFADQVVSSVRGEFVGVPDSTLRSVDEVAVHPALCADRDYRTTLPHGDPLGDDPDEEMIALSRYTWWNCLFSPFSYCRLER